MLNSLNKINLVPIRFLAYLVIAIAGMKAFSSVLNIILVALLIAIILKPILVRLLKRGWSKALSLTVIIVILVISATALTLLLGAALSQMNERLPYYNERITQVYNEGLESLAARGVNIEEIENLEVFSPQKLFDISASFLSGIFSTLGNFVFVLLLTIFTLIEFANIKVDTGQSATSEDRLKRGLLGLFADVRKYLSITAIIGLLVAIGQLILMLILGIEFAFVWAFLSFIFNFIPNIGFVLTIIPPALLALLEYGWITCLIVVIGFSVINSFFGDVIKPRFVGKEFDMSLLTVFLSLLFWTWVLGPIGAVLSVPLTITVQKSWEIFNEDNENAEDEYKDFKAQEN